MMQCIAEGHDVVALANLRPKDKGKGYTTDSIIPDMWYGDFVFGLIFAEIFQESLISCYPVFQTNWTVTCFRR